MIGGVAHTHSRHATMFAQSRRGIPCLGTTHADHFHGPVPITRPLQPRGSGRGLRRLYRPGDRGTVPGTRSPGHAGRVGCRACALSPGAPRPRRRWTTPSPWRLSPKWCWAAGRSTAPRRNWSPGSSTSTTSENMAREPPTGKGSRFTPAASVHAQCMLSSAICFSTVSPWPTSFRVKWPPLATWTRQGALSLWRWLQIRST